MFDALRVASWGHARSRVATFLRVAAFVVLASSSWMTGTSYAIATTTIVYAAPAGMTSGTCDTWAHACDMQYALTVAAGVTPAQIWAEHGTYKPTTTTDRTATFQLHNSVALYGGFAGNETMLSGRDWTSNVTILSGEIGDPGLTLDNVYHVLVGSGTDSTAVVDGFTVTAGYASDPVPTNYSGHEGGGLLNYGGSPTISHVIFDGNTATEGGGAVWNQNVSAPTFTDVVFSHNVGPFGGGMYSTGPDANATLTDVSFLFNTNSGHGGGMSNDGGASPHLTNVTFIGNYAVIAGGGLENQDGGGPTLVNVTFYNNSSGGKGGAIYNTNGFPTFTNVTVSGNTASTAGSGMYTDINSTVTVNNSIFWGDTTDEIVNNGNGTTAINDSVVQGGCPSSGSSCNTNVLNADPLLEAPAFNGGLTESLALEAGSSALNTASNTDCPPTDQRGVTRPQGGVCDMGSYEHIYAPVAYASQGGLTSGFCDSWAKSCELWWALRNAASGQQLWVKTTTILGYYPTSGTDRSGTFALKDGVQVYGGFAGTETALAQRDPTANRTILSGNIGSLLLMGDNSLHVVTAIGVDSTAVLDGFWIGDGNANGTGTDANGGGIYNTGSPTLRNLMLGGNLAASFGGGMYNMGGTPSLNNITFEQNQAGLGGGGMFNTSGAAGLINATFSSNTAGLYGGGMENDYSLASLLNVTFSGNSAGTAGGAIENYFSNSNVYNSIFWGDGTEFDNQSTAPTIVDSVIQGGCPSGATCTHILTGDPHLGVLKDNSGPAWTISALPGSSALDSAALNSSCASVDERGISRPRGPGCDIGAFERIPPFSDFEGDYKTDPAKFYSSNGTAWWFKSSSSTWSGMYLGSDVSSYVAHSDFDGDGKVDPAKWVSSSNTLWYFGSKDSAWHGVYMGTDVASIVPGSDFDGDGKADPAKYTALGYIWYHGSSDSLWHGVYIGTDGVPLWGSDYDGDGITDPAKYVASSGTIWYLSSKTGLWNGMYVGNDGDPVPASDFDGDGRTDMAKFVSSTNTLWYFGSSDSTWHGVYLGPGTIRYVEGADFDGDGKTDPGTFNSSTGALWYLPSSTSVWHGVVLGNDTFDIAD